MVYKIHLNAEEYDSYLDKLINKIYAVLGVYEDCDKRGSFDEYFAYLNRLCIELRGCTSSIKTDGFLSVYNTLVGMLQSEAMEHKQVRSTVFHCISIIKKI